MQAEVYDAETAMHKAREKSADSTNDLQPFT